MDDVTFGRTGLRVSQIALGTASFGTGWGHGADADTATAIFNAYADAGGNVIDTSDIYQFGQSEQILGEALQGRREDFLLATKYSSGASPGRTAIVDAVLRIAAEIGASPDQVAIAWAGSHGAIPMIGPRRMDQLTSNLGALSVTLSDDQMRALDRISALSDDAPDRVAMPWGADAAPHVVA